MDIAGNIMRNGRSDSKISTGLRAILDASAFFERLWAVYIRYFSSCGSNIGHLSGDLLEL